MGARRNWRQENPCEAMNRNVWPIPYRRREEELFWSGIEEYGRPDKNSLSTAT